MTQIPDVHEHAQEKCVVHGRIDKTVFNYFFRHLLAGNRGDREHIIAFFFQALYEECLKSGLKPTWDEENEAKVWAVLQRMNFEPQRTAATRKPKA